MPHWNLGQEELYLNSKPIERAVFEMRNISDLTKAFKRNYNHQFVGQILTIPFERFVLDPWQYIQQVEKLLGSKVTGKTKK